jgi:hypothetical protein
VSALEVFQFGSLSREGSSSQTSRDEQIFIALDVERIARAFAS